MKGKYISTSLMLAVLAGGKEESLLHINETKASTQDHQLIWVKKRELARIPKTKVQ